MLQMQDECMQCFESYDIRYTSYSYIIYQYQGICSVSVKQKWFTKGSSCVKNRRKSTLKGWMDTLETLKNTNWFQSCVCFSHSNQSAELVSYILADAFITFCVDKAQINTRATHTPYSYTHAVNWITVATGSRAVGNIYLSFSTIRILLFPMPEAEVMG